MTRKKIIENRLMGKGAEDKLARELLDMESTWVSCCMRWYNNGTQLGLSAQPCGFACKNG
jgi:hypothetical protein